MKWTSLWLAFLTMGAGLLAISADGPGEQVELAVLKAENWDACVPSGKEVDAIYGDIVLRNRYLTAVIAEPLASRHANMTTRDVGGCLIDLTACDAQSDQLACFYPGRKGIPFRSWSASVNGEDLGVMGTGTHGLGQSAAVTVTAAGDSQRPAVEVRYSLDAQQPFLTVRSKYTNTGSKPLTISLADDIRADNKKEEMTKSPNGKAEQYWIEDSFWRQAYAVRSPERALLCNTDGNNGVLKYVDEQDHEQVELPPGQSVEVVRQIACGMTRVHTASAFRADSAPRPKEVKLRLMDAMKRGIDHAQFDILQEDTVIAASRANREGELTLPLGEGDYRVRLLSNGKPLDEAALHIGQPERQTPQVVFNGYRPGTVSVDILSEEGKPIPCKVEFIGEDGTPSPHFGPESASFGVRNLRYSPDGNFIVHLLPGNYRVIVSRGPEYDALFETISISSGQNTRVRGTLKRTVNTAGWVSGDFHSHSSPSGDNTSSQLGRVLNLVCEHIEFAPCTEHNRITSYQPHFDRLGINAWIASTTGMELTGSPLPLNHQNVFPLHHHPHTQDGGGPTTDQDVDVQVQRLAAWDDGSDKLIQQNHPDIGWLFYDRNGDGVHDGGHAAAVALLDVMEIHPVEDVLKLASPGAVSSATAKSNRIFKWLQLTNAGYRIPGVVNTDAHYNFHGSGGLRNWIQSPTDHPAQIQPMDIVHASEEGRVVMSNGPFLEVWAHAEGTDKKVTAGQDLAAPAGKVQLEIAVQCPNWFDVDTVFVLINGRLSQEQLWTRQKHPQLFSNEPVRFRQSIPLILDKDAHLVVVTGHSSAPLGPVMGPEVGKTRPAALSNPIFVDVDGNGFTPNQDSLGLPLPVKGD